jgi:hypothetical protein
VFNHTMTKSIFTIPRDKQIGMAVVLAVLLTVGLVGITISRKEHLMPTAIQTFIAAQTAQGAGGATAAYYDASGGASIAGENGVIGLQSANLTGFGAMILPNAAADYRVAIDGNGDYTITDTATNTTVAGGGLANIVFDNGATTTTGSGATAATSYTQELFVESAADVQIAAFYQAVLGRVPDLPGLQYWEADLAKGDSLVNIAAGFVTSTEFLARFPSASLTPDKGGPHDTAFVTALYNNILDRAPDAGGLAYWVDSLATGAETRDTLLIAFTGSAENLSYITAADGALPLAATALPLGTATQWLVNEGTGGFTSLGASQALLSEQAAFTQAAATGLLNEALIDWNQPTGVTVAVPAGGSISDANITRPDIAPGVGGTGYLTVSAANMTIEKPSQTVVLVGNNSTITNGASTVIEGANETVNLAGTGDQVLIYAPLIAGAVGMATLDQSVTVTGYIPGQDDLTFSTPALATGNMGLPITILTPTVALPASVNHYNTNTVYLIDVGNVGSGSAAEVAAAANKVYLVTDANGVPGNPHPEQAIFFGTTTSGNTVFEMWSTGNGGVAVSADTNHNYKVDASEFVQSVTLVGVTASQITTADFVTH